MRRKIKSLFLKIGLVLVLFFVSAVSLQGTEIEKTYHDLFKDENFAKIVAMMNKKSYRDIATRENLENIEVIKLIDGGAFPETTITSIEGIAYLKNLKCLEIMGNKIESLPSEINKLIKLDILNLNNNNIKSIPESIGELYYLKELHLCNNAIETVPKSIGKLRLEELMLSNNEIRELPETIFDMRTLKVLGVDHNQLGNVSTASFFKTAQLDAFLCNDNHFLIDAKSFVFSYLKTNVMYMKVVEFYYLLFPAFS